MGADQLFFFITLLAALGCGLIAGVFFAFSAFVMKALARLAPGNGVAAMQSINVVVLNPWFLGVFMGTAVLSAVATVASLFRWGEPDAAYRLGGGLLYLAGTFFVTIAFNVPRNNALASVAATDPRAAEMWTEYVRSWTAWNHVRTAAAFAAAALFSLALSC